MAFDIPLCFALNYDEWIFQGLSTIDETNHGQGWDINEIANYITERHEVPEDFREQLIGDLRCLEYEGEIVLNLQNEEPDRYKIRYNILIHSKEPEVSLVPEVALVSINATETTTISENYQRPQDKQSSSSSSSVPTESEKRAQLMEIVDAVVHAEHYEFKAKEAFNNIVWAYENLKSLFVARRIVINCANGYKIYMRKGVSPGPVQ